MWNVIVLKRFYGCLFCLSKKSFCEKMSNFGRFIIGEFVTAKAIHVLHISEYARRYGSDKKAKRLVGLVVANVNIPTATGRASWVVRVWFHLGADAFLTDRTIGSCSFVCPPPRWNRT